MQTFDFSPGGRLVNTSANFIRYERDNAGAVSPGVRVRADGSDFGVWLPGDWCELEATVSLIELAPVGLAAGEFRIGRGRFGGQRQVLVGSVAANIVTARAAQATLANTQRTVTNASAQLVAASPGRQYLLIQNKDATGTIFIVHTTGPATVAAGVRIGPGGFWEHDALVPVGAVFAIGDIASNANIVTVEG